MNKGSDSSKDRTGLRILHADEAVTQLAGSNTTNAVSRQAESGAAFCGKNRVWYYWQNGAVSQSPRFGGLHFAGKNQGSSGFPGNVFRSLVMVRFERN